MKPSFNQGRWIVLSVILVVLFLANISLGSVRIPLSDILAIVLGGNPAQPVWTAIVLDFRLTKALTCILAGGSLAVSGLQMQTLFRNPLAGPDVLGLSSGASLMVSLVFMSEAIGFSLFPFSSPWTVAVAASFGCIVVFSLVLVIAQRLQSNVSLLIIGLMIGAATSSIVSVLQFISRAEDQQSFLIWTFGSVGGMNWPEIRVLALVLLIGTTMAIGSIKAMNAWLLGENYAASLGVNIRRARFRTIVATSLLTGAVTAFCGPIAFVGLAVPHLTKLLINTNDHKTLVPAVLLFGSALMLFCDIVAQLPGSSHVLPLNAITALIGAPVVIWIVVRSKKYLM